MIVLNCTTEREFELSTDWREWLVSKGYEFCDSSVVGIFTEDVSALSFKIEAFVNAKKNTWAISYPPINEKAKGALFVEIHNSSYAALLMELGVCKITSSAYQAIAEAKANG